VIRSGIPDVGECRPGRAIIVAEEPGLGLSAALEALREELEAAWTSSQGSVVRFRVSEITLTLEAMASRSKELGGKIRWWIIEAGGGGKAGTQATQTLVLTLTPGLYDAQGRPGPLDVAGDQAEPGG
jgi:NTP-dependent ternary system trypsin peptidase co-occuring protein